LPNGFQRIRYYGFLGNRYRTEKLARCRQLLGMAASAPPAPEAGQDYRDRCQELTGSSLQECPVCHRGRMAGSGDPAAQTQPADGGHRHLMTLTLENPVILPRTNFAWSSQRTSVATSVTKTIRRQIEGIRRATHNLSLAASQRLPACFLIGSTRLFLPANSRATIKTHKADILLRFSPIHF
jgi:hypothetical protein